MEENQTKFCKDCKHLVGVRHNENEKNNWNCGHPTNDGGISPADLVTGRTHRIFKITIHNLRYPPIHYLELDICRAEGKFFEQYEPPNYIDDRPQIGGQVAEELIFDEASQVAMREAAAKRLAEIKARKGK